MCKLKVMCVTARQRRQHFAAYGITIMVVHVPLEGVYVVVPRHSELMIQHKYSVRQLPCEA